MSSADSRSADLVRTNNASVVHVRGDSETELDLLFSVLNNNEPKHPAGQTYRNKNLPLSFFQPPEPRPSSTHSREVSLDYGPTGNQAEIVCTVYHGRSHSSPAKLPVSLSLAPAASSFDHLREGLIDGLPSVTSSRYFSNNSNPAWNSVPSKLPQGCSVISSQNIQSVEQLPNGNLRALPLGWDQAMTPEGEIYFIDHINKKTSWYDPRLPKELQKAAVTKALSQHRAPKHQQHISLVQQPVAVAPQPGSIVAQQQQQQQPGRLLTNTSSPLVPVVNLVAGGASKQNQVQQHQCLQNSMSTSHQLMSGVGLQSLRNIPASEQLIRQKLQKVQENKERLSRLQDECFREEQRLMTELRNHTQGTVLSTNSADRALSELMSGNNHLTQCPDLPHHQQQLQQQQQHQQQQSEYVLNGLTSALDLDGTPSAQTASESIPMDSDELVSSLTDDFGRDLLSMDIQMMDIFL